ncbi:anti-anti-sigma factor [Nonomuraea thailandensis]|jgi:anti-anti-sigma factor|uniref:Anti-sigma factor antagonist n=2 Tax=Nonomuraea TaxID=83681 RepID=A0A9X2GV28_9ACTN|nr:MULTISPECIES: STAS domain-containing protein [Nonomuraea]MCP2361368.1 anti-anti-sigma factor [Nonomuraea thailandensis]UBU15148.1 STAS domain-containing protein [Nonomuraea gerenzanensis]SBO92890.1 anti-sigma factor antagonist [Nonomuraea gerenzanensis]
MRVRGNPGAQVVRIGARLDAGTSAGVRERLHKALDSGEGDLILDLSKLEMIDATGLGVLVGAHRRALSVERRLVLRGVPPRIMRILAVTRLNRVLHVEAPAAAVA